LSGFLNRIFNYSLQKESLKGGGRMRKRVSLVTALALVIVSLFAGAMLNTLISGDSIRDQTIKFQDVLSLAVKNYVEDIDTQKLTESAITGMLGQLDPHSVYIPASQLHRVQEEFQGSFEGIGVEFQVLNDTLLVVAAIPGGPSEALGIQSGDKILKIDDTSAVGITQEQVPKKLRGPKGTKVRVSVLRTGIAGLLEFEITRDKIPLYTVDASFMATSDIGYIRVTRFAATTHDEFVEGVTKLRKEGMKRLILDLRENAGGFLDQAIKISDELMPQGRKIVYTKGRGPQSDDEYLSTGGGHFQDLPLILLVNAGSASASEIVAGAVQDWDRGLIVGETTFGKGLVQRQYDLRDGSAVRITTARYYTPSGRLIQRPWGKDLVKYLRGVRDREEAEGDNLSHEAEKDSAHPVYKTMGGRKVYGGGGITPDYLVKSERLNEYTIQLWSRQVFLQFADQYADTHGSELKNEYGRDIPSFVKNFTVTEDMREKVLAIAKAKGIEFKKDLYEKDSKYITAYIRAFLARRVWGNEGWSRVMLEEDGQYNKAVALFPEAEKIAKLLSSAK
jgi:carboxyl-terminal processing protease